MAVKEELVTPILQYPTPSKSSGYSGYTSLDPNNFDWGERLDTNKTYLSPLLQASGIFTSVSPFKPLLIKTPYSNQTTTQLPK